MKTIDEMIAVMTAYKEGKPIECRAKDDDNAVWISISGPAWNFFEADYRVKPEPKYVPYDSVLEIDRNKWISGKDVNEIIYKIDAIDTRENTLRLSSGSWLTLRELFYDGYAYEDGTPCGKLVQNEG